MSDETQTAAQPARAAEPADTSVELSELLDDQEIAIRLMPRSERAGHVRVFFAPPAAHTVTVYDGHLFGLNGKKQSAEEATKSVIRSRFLRVEGLRMPEECRAKFAGDWKKWLVGSSQGMQVAYAVASAYIARARVKTDGVGGEGEDSEDE
jgi:hypothetical protein